MYEKVVEFIRGSSTIFNSTAQHSTAQHSTAQHSTAQIIYLGNTYGEHIHDGFGGAVFSKYGLCPAIKTCQGGNRQPMIVEEND